MGKTMKKRIFCGAICEQIIYNVADNADPLRHDPEKKSGLKRKRNIRNSKRRFRGGSIIGAFRRITGLEICFAHLRSIMTMRCLSGMWRNRFGLSTAGH